MRKSFWMLYTFVNPKHVCLRISGVQKSVIFPSDPESVIVNEKVIGPSSLSVSLPDVYLC